MTGPNGVFSAIAACNSHGIQDSDSIAPGIKMRTEYGEIELSKEVAKFALKKATRNNVREILEPLRGSADAVTFRQDNDEDRRIRREDLELFGFSLTDAESEVIEHERLSLEILGAHFEGRNPWRMRAKLSGETNTYGISDNSFRSAINQQLRIGKGCVLDAMVSWKRKGETTSAHEVKRVITCVGPDGEILYPNPSTSGIEQQQRLWSS